MTRLRHTVAARTQHEKQTHNHCTLGTNGYNYEHLLDVRYQCRPSQHGLVLRCLASVMLKTLGVIQESCATPPSDSIPTHHLAITNKCSCKVHIIVQDTRPTAPPRTTPHTKVHIHCTHKLAQSEKTCAFHSVLSDKKEPRPIVRQERLGRWYASYV